jgi:ankyrin repeat protein
MPIMPQKPFYSPLALQRTEQARDVIRRHDYVSLNTLLTHGMNPNIPASDGRFLVHDAILFDAGGTAVDILMHYHADINARWGGYLNWTPAHIAWFAGRADIVEKLRRLGADLSLEDTRGWSACRALPCPITQIEAARKFSGFGDMVGHTTATPVFA